MNLPSSRESYIQRVLASTGQMVWAIVCGTLLILLAMFFIVRQVANHERELAYANAMDVNSKIVQNDEIRVRSMLTSLDKVLLVLRRDFADNPKLSNLAFSLWLDELKIDNDLNPRISLTNANGDVLLSSASSNGSIGPKFNIADRAYFQKQKTDQGDLLDVGVPIESRMSGNWVVPLTRRITRQDGSFGGVIAMTVDPGLFTSETFGADRMGRDSSRAIIGLDGYIRLRLISGKLSFEGDAHKSQVFTELNKSKVGSYTAITAVDGVTRLVSYRLIDPYSIIILAGSSVDSIEGTYRDKVRGYFIGASLFGALIVLLSGVLILGVVRQRNLFESQQSFKHLIESVPQLVSKLDLHGNIIWVNRQTVEYVGPGVDEQSRGFDWVQDAVHPEDRARVKDFVSAALQLKPDAQACEYRKRRVDGEYVWFTSRITRVLDKEGGGLFFLQTGTDIHDRKMAEERAKVSQRLESIGQLTGGMAHDFNNLLAIIVGNLDLVKTDVKVDAATKRLDVAIGAAQRGVGLVKSLLALASKQPLLPARIDLWPLIERITPLLRHALGQRVHLEVRPPEAIVHVDVDEAGLEAVLLNLIVNARDAMPKGGNLILGLEASDGMACIAVEDSGMGMPQAVLRRATEPFFTTKEHGHGTGLGLSMVAGFVKQSSGRLKIQSEEGKGTKIEVFLPLAMAAPVPDVSVAMASQQTTATEKRRILIVDDETALAELVRDWAKAEGHTAVVTNSADDALVLLAVKAFDVLLTDIIMPGELDGIGLAKKANAMYPAMRILLMSGFSKATATNRVEIPWPLLVKPFGKEDFYSAMHRAFLGSDLAPLE